MHLALEASPKPMPKPWDWRLRPGAWGLEPGGLKKPGAWGLEPEHAWGLPGAWGLVPEAWNLELGPRM